ncbi:hypothetical protein GO013_14695 [Pseudodesulfovibrio sp. JC047]|uniref:hypothetical protein n=1 Tax=Pseudodesulfovibrio sp. JC047 TaxID=2683199 RepID=UPI0013CFD3B2|nr:hypothetical protein [Pseudodesulfovibrio sp. JC047]NDV20657.1 hypothetical protein [Pseudodesulfovibrio sp. JC047]
MRRKRTSHSMEKTRNTILVLLAVSALAIFFNLDAVRHGRSIFTNHAQRQLKFSGSLEREDFSAAELKRMTAYLSQREKYFKEVTIKASPQDSYRKVTPSTPILFEIQVTMKDGFTFTTPTRRTTRAQLQKSVLAKLDKDVQVYLKLKKSGKKPGGLINTM